MRHAMPPVIRQRSVSSPRVLMSMRANRRIASSRSPPRIEHGDVDLRVRHPSASATARAKVPPPRRACHARADLAKRGQSSRRAAWWRCAAAAARSCTVLLPSRPRDRGCRSDALSPCRRARNARLPHRTRIGRRLSVARFLWLKAPACEGQSAPNIAAAEPRTSGHRSFLERSHSPRGSQTTRSRSSSPRSLQSIAPCALQCLSLIPSFLSLRRLAALGHWRPPSLRRRR